VSVTCYARPSLSQPSRLVIEVPETLLWPARNCRAGDSSHGRDYFQTTSDALERVTARCGLTAWHGVCLTAMA